LIKAMDLGQLAQFWEVVGQVRIVRRFTCSQKDNTGFLGRTSLLSAFSQYLRLMLDLLAFFR
jgi:hypothetical protein